MKDSTTLAVLGGLAALYFLTRQTSASQPKQTTASPGTYQDPGGLPTVLAGYNPGAAVASAMPIPLLRKGHTYTVHMRTTGPISDTEIARRMAVPYNGARVGEWWREAPDRFAFRATPTEDIDLSVDPTMSAYVWIDEVSG